ncbi:acyltransferase family protein [Oryzihumus sp.]
MTVPPARWPYLDNLRTLLVAGIIAGHGVLGYSGEFGWTYQGYRETSLAGLTQTVVLAVVGPFAVFLIALLFLISGLLTPGSLQRKGTGAYVRDRVLRLGVPWAVFALLVFPTLVHWLDRGIRHSRATWWQDMRRLVPTLDTGPLWFLPVLLLFSFGYAVWWRTAAISPRTRRGGAPTGRTVALLVAGVAGGTFIVRLWLGLDTNQIAGLQVWQWPECAGLFALGTVASGHGWLVSVPSGIRRGTGQAVVAGVLVAIAVIIAVGPTRITGTDLAGGWNLPALGVAALEATLTVCGPIWLLAKAQARLHFNGPQWRRAGRGAYTAYLLQAPVLLGLAVLLRPVPVAAEVKALVVAVGGVLLCFDVGSLLVRRTRLGRHL